MSDEWQEDERVISAATPGPWDVDQKLYIGQEGGTHGFREIVSRIRAVWIARVQGFTDDKGEYRANATFIARARTRWPEALREIERLRAELAAAQERIRELEAK